MILSILTMENSHSVILELEYEDPVRKYGVRIKKAINNICFIVIGILILFQIYSFACLKDKTNKVRFIDKTSTTIMSLCSIIISYTTYISDNGSGLSCKPKTQRNKICLVHMFFILSVFASSAMITTTYISCSFGSLKIEKELEGINEVLSKIVMIASFVISYVSWV